MRAERERVRELVREELGKRLGPREPQRSQTDVPHPALAVLHLPGDDPKDPGSDVPPPCVIEPDRPCYQSGYCKRLGY